MSINLTTREAFDNIATAQGWVRHIDVATQERSDSAPGITSPCSVATEPPAGTPRLITYGHPAAGRIIATFDRGGDCTSLRIQPAAPLAGTAHRRDGSLSDARVTARLDLALKPGKGGQMLVVEKDQETLLVAMAAVMRSANPEVA